MFQKIVCNCGVTLLLMSVGTKRNSLVCVATAPHVEFSKPLQDVEVRERESAKFECEVSRESAKVRPPASS